MLFQGSEIPKGSHMAGKGAKTRFVSRKNEEERMQFIPRISNCWCREGPKSEDGGREKTEGQGWGTGEV
jgi:hypothetical protein